MANSFRCQNCTRSYDTEEKYIEHVKFCNQIGYECKQCGEINPTYPKAYTHVKKCNGVSTERVRALIAENALLRDIVSKDTKKKERYMKVKHVEAPIPCVEEPKVLEEEIFKNKAYDKFFYGESEESITKMIEEKAKKDDKDISKDRLALIRFVEIEKVIRMVHTHYTNKRYTNKNFSTLERKLCYIPGYHDTKLILNPNDIILFRVGILRYLASLELTPYSKDVFIQRYNNYSLAFLSIKDRLSEELRLTKNIIYIDLPKKANDTDDYSFYTFSGTKEEKGKIINLWVMDCRLKDLINTFCKELCKYLQEIFRKLYFLLQEHNNYTKDFLTKFRDSELTQILQNFLWINNTREVYDFFHTNIKKYNTLNPTENDRINVSIDDKIQKKAYEKLLETDHVADTIKKMEKYLFDESDTDDMKELYKEINIDIKI